MDILSSKDWPSKSLSNFAPHRFTFRGVECNSMEGLLQSLKFENVEKQKEMCKLTGFAAKKAGRKKKWFEDQKLYWNGVAMKRDSKEYQELLDEAFEELFSTNKKAQKALLATGSEPLKHSIGKNKKSETVLTEKEFCSRLMNIRSKLRNNETFSQLGE